MALSTPKMDKLKMGTKLADADNAFGHKQALKVKKQKKSQGSSRYRPIGAQELVALALLKGTKNLFMYYFLLIYVPTVFVVYFYFSLVIDKLYIHL